MENRKESNLIEKLICINRVTKVVKGGRIMRFAAVMVVGDGKGSVGMGLGKGREVPLAVNKALEAAKRKMFKVNLKGGTVFHEVHGRYCASRILVQPAGAGTGIIAGGPVRAVFEALGVENVLAKNFGSTNPHNILRAALRALAAVRSPTEVATRRGKPVSEIERRHKINT